MIADLEGIIHLNVIDQEIFQLNRKKDDLPQEIEKIKESMQMERQELSSLEARFQELDQDVKRLEDEVRDHKTGLTKSEERLMHIKTNEEYDAVHSEIATRKSKISEGEDQILRIMAEKEALEAKITEAKGKQDNEAAKAKEAALQSLQQEHQGLENAVAEAQSRRTEAVKKIGSRFLQIYERIHRIKKTGNHVSLVTDKKRFCTICGCSLTAQRFIEVKRNNAINTCEACGSILIWKMEEGAQS